MTLIDPTGGAEYDFEQLFTPQDASTAFIQLPRALDGSLGGDHDLTGNLNVLTSNNSNVRIQNLLIGKDGSSGVFETETGVNTIINDDIQIHGLADFITNIQVGGNATVTGNITANGNNSYVDGIFRYRDPFIPTNYNNQTISLNTIDLVYIPDGVMPGVTVARYTLSDYQDGDVIHFVNKGTGYVVIEDNTHIIPAITTSAPDTWLLLQYILSTDSWIHLAHNDI